MNVRGGSCLLVFAVLIVLAAIGAGRSGLLISAGPSTPNRRAHHRLKPD